MTEPGKSAPSRRRRTAIAALIAVTSVAALGTGLKATAAGALVRATRRLAAARLELSYQSLHLGWRRGPAVEIDGVRIVDSTAKMVGLRIERVTVGPRWTRLLRGEIVIGDVALDRPELRLAPESEGGIDWRGVVERIRTETGDGSSARAAPSSGGPSASRLADRIEVRRGRLEWLDRGAAGARQAALDPVDLSVVRTGKSGPFDLALHAALADPSRSQGADTAALTAKGTVGDARSGSWGESPVALDLRLAHADLSLLTPWLPPGLGARARLGGIADVSARVEGSLHETLTGQASLAVADGSWSIPVACPDTRAQKHIAARARFQRRAGTITAEDLAVDSDDLHARGRLELADAGGADPVLRVEVESPWLDLVPVARLLPVEILGRVVPYFARVVDRGRGRVVPLRIERHLHDTGGDASSERTREGLSGRLEFEGAGGVPYPGLARFSDVTGAVGLSHGDVAIDGFAGLYAHSELSAVHGAVHDPWGAATLELHVDRASVELADLHELLGSTLMPEPTRRAMQQIEVSSGRLDGSARFDSARHAPLQVSGQGTVSAAALRWASRDLAFHDVSGPVELANGRLATGGLDVSYGASSARLRGSLDDSLEDPTLDLEISAKSFAAEDAFRLADRAQDARSGLPKEPHPGRLSGRLRLHGAIARPAELERSARLTLEGVDVGPPLVAQPLERVSGQVSLDGDRARFDLDQLTWRGLRARASGSVSELGGEHPQVEVDGQALEPVDLDRLAEQQGVGDASPPGAGPPAAHSAMPSVTGHVVFPQARFRDTPVDDLDASFRFQPHELGIDHARGRALGGRFDVSARIALPVKDGSRVEIDPHIEGVDAPGLLTMLTVPWKALSGRADVTGHVAFTLPVRSALDALTGQLDVTLEEGRIEQASTLWTVLDVVDFSSSFASPAAWRESGLEYRDVTGEIELGQGCVRTHGLDLHGPTVNLTVAGRLGLADQRVDGVVALSPLSPFPFVDRLLDPIPVLGTIKRGLGMSLIAFHVQGRLGEVTVTSETLDRIDSLLDDLLPGTPQDPPTATDPSDGPAP